MTPNATTMNERVVQTQQECAAQLAELGMLRTQAQREVETCTARMSVLEWRMSAMQVATTTLAGLAPLAPEQEWLDHLTTWRKALCDELLACPQQPRTDHELGKQQNLKLSIITIDRGPSTVGGTGYCLENLRLGQLMREAGYVEGPALAGRRSGDLPWCGAIPQVERRIQEWTRQRDEAQAMLDDALVDDDARAKKDAENAARVAKLNAMSREEQWAAQNLACENETS